MRLPKNKKLLHISLATFMAVSGLSSVLFVQHAHAATLSEAFVRFDRMAISTPTTGTVCAMPATTSTDVKTWSVTFPTGYTVNATGANWQTTNISTADLSWPGTPTPTAWPNATSATAAVVGQTVTWTNASAQTMNSGTMYCYNWTSTSTVTIKSSATSSNSGTITTTDSSSADIDTGSYSTASIDNDQIQVNATVPVAFAFSLDANTDDLPELSTADVKSSDTPINAQVDTNAKNGWAVWAKDAWAGIKSSTASYTIDSNCSAGSGSSDTLSAGTEGYNLGTTQSQVGGEGTISLNSVFDNQTSPAAGQGGGLCTTFQQLASSDGSADTAIIAMTNNVSISPSTPAATDYTDTITVVGAGLF